MYSFNYSFILTPRCCRYLMPIQCCFIGIIPSFTTVCSHRQFQYMIRCNSPENIAIITTYNIRCRYYFFYRFTTFLAGSHQSSRLISLCRFCDYTRIPLMCSSICFCDCKSPVICTVVCRQSQCHGTSRYDHGLSCKLIIDEFLIQLSVFFINIEEVIIVCFKLCFFIKGQDDFFCTFHGYCPVCRCLRIVRMIGLQICRIDAVNAVIIFTVFIAAFRTGHIIICHIFRCRIIISICLDHNLTTVPYINMIYLCSHSIYCTARNPLCVGICCPVLIRPCQIIVLIINTGIYFRCPGKCRNCCRCISGIIKVYPRI